MKATGCFRPSTSILPYLVCRHQANGTPLQLGWAPILGETPPSYFNNFLLLGESNNFAEVVHDSFEFGDRLGGEVLRFGQLVAVFKRFVLEPRDVQLVAAFLDFIDAETTKAFDRVAFTRAVRIVPIRLFEF